MKRQNHKIELSNHMKNKLHRYRTTQSSSNCSDNFLDSPNTEYERGNSYFLSLFCLHLLHSIVESTYITPVDEEEEEEEEVLPNESYLSSKRATQYESRSYLMDNYQKQRLCKECPHRHYLLQVEHERLQRLYNENKKLHEQLRSSLSLSRHYKDENYRLKDHLIKINAHLYQYQLNIDQLKQEIHSEKKTSPKIQIEDSADEQQRRLEHLKRLRYEIEMYNRLTAAKEKQEEKQIQRKQIDFLF